MFPLLKTVGVQTNELTFFVDCSIMHLARIIILKLIIDETIWPCRIRCFAYSELCRALRGSNSIYANIELMKKINCHSSKHIPDNRGHIAVTAFLRSSCFEKSYAMDTYCQWIVGKLFGNQTQFLWPINSILFDQNLLELRLKMTSKTVRSQLIPNDTVPFKFCP